MNLAPICATVGAMCYLLLSTIGGAEGAEPKKTMLPNGVRLVLKREPASELVAISICIRTEPDRNAIDDAAGEMAARSLFSSSFNRSHDNIALSIAHVGGSVEMLRTPEHVNITCVTLPAQVREAVYLLCEVLKNADFGALERVRADLIAEQQSATSDLAGGLDLVRRALQARTEFADLPFRRVTRAQTVAYFQGRYVPERTAIAVVGQFDPATIQTAFRDSLADFDRHAVHAIRAEPLYSHATNFPCRILNRPGNSGCALAATAAPSLSDMDYAAFIVLKSVLGEGHASRLFQRVRDARGIGYSVGALWQTSLSDPLITYLQWDATAPRRTEDRAGERRVTASAAGSKPSAGEDRFSPDAALQLLTAQLDGMVSEPPTDAEIARARSVAIGRENLRHERARDRAFLLATYEAMGAGAEFDADLPRKLAAVTREDVMRAARTYLTPRASALIVPGPVASVKTTSP